MADAEIDQDSLADLTGELRYLLNQWDPIGIYNEELDFPRDEYDCLIGPILTRLARRDGRAGLSEYLWSEIEHHFGLDPVRCGTDAFAYRLQEWYAAKNPRRGRRAGAMSGERVSHSGDRHFLDRLALASVAEQHGDIRIQIQRVADIRLTVSR